MAIKALLLIAVWLVACRPEEPPPSPLETGRDCMTVLLEESLVEISNYLRQENFEKAQDLADNAYDYAWERCTGPDVFDDPPLEWGSERSGLTQG